MSLYESENIISFMNEMPKFFFKAVSLFELFFLLNVFKFFFQIILLLLLL